MGREAGCVNSIIKSLLKLIFQLIALESLDSNFALFSSIPTLDAVRLWSSITQLPSYPITKLLDWVKLPASREQNFRKCRITA